MFIFPESGYFYIVGGTLLFAVFMTGSFVGSLILILRLRGRALPVYAALPLCSITGFIAIMYILLTFYEPSIPGLRPLALTITGGILGFAVLPAGAAYFLNFWSGTCPVAKTYLQLLKGIGILGLLFFAGIIADAILDTPASSSQYHDNFLNFTPAGAALTLFGLLFGAVLLPVAGLVILRYGMKYRSIPYGTD
jgi:hypothetical protein